MSLCNNTLFRSWSSETAESVDEAEQGYYRHRGLMLHLVLVAADKRVVRPLQTAAAAASGTEHTTQEFVEVKHDPPDLQRQALLSSPLPSPPPHPHAPTIIELTPTANQTCPHAVSFQAPHPNVLRRPPEFQRMKRTSSRRKPVACVHVPYLPCAQSCSSCRAYRRCITVTISCRPRRRRLCLQRPLISTAASLGLAGRRVAATRQLHRMHSP